MKALTIILRSLSRRYKLLILSVIAALELPLYIDGIRKIIGIEDLYVYNLSTYIGLVLIIVVFIIFRTRKKY